MSDQEQESRGDHRPKNCRIAGRLSPDLEARVRSAGGDPVREERAVTEWARGRLEEQARAAGVTLPRGVSLVEMSRLIDEAKARTASQVREKADRAARLAELSRRLAEAEAREKARTAGRARP